MSNVHGDDRAEARAHAEDMGFGFCEECGTTYHPTGTGEPHCLAPRVYTGPGRPKDVWAEQEPYDPYDHEALANEPV